MTSPTCPRCLSSKPAVYVRDGAWSTGVDNLVCFDAVTGKCAG